MDPLISLENVWLEYPGEKAAQTATILQDISLQVTENDIIALLGPSGCGKSTLIRLIAGLIAPTRGTVKFHGQAVAGICPGVAMVFQNFALFPWLTVEGNILLPLKQNGLEEGEIRSRVAQALNMVGLDGYENVYPRELSGGMKQRVGIARALAVKPEVLCMDEPFSALDVLTGESLRNELGRLCADSANPLRTMISVTHNIEEAVYLAKRVIVLAAHPGRIALDLPNPLPYPRNPDSPEFRAVVEKIHAILTHQELPDTDSAHPVALNASRSTRVQPLPRSTMGDIVALVSVLGEEPQEIFELSDEFEREFGAILRLVKAAEILRLVETPGDLIELTALGRKFQKAHPAERKTILAEQMKQILIFHHVLGALAKAPEHRITVESLAGQLAIWLPNEKPEVLLHTMISWGRYAQLLSYDSVTKTLALP